MWDMHDGMGWWMVFGSIWMLVFWVLLIAGAAWVVTGLFQRSGRSPLDIAQERYARGELSREEFQRMREDLQRRG
jgi:putative membrane protein